MTNNTLTAHAKTNLDITLVPAQKRLMRARLKKGSYQAVADLVGVNVRYVYELCVKNIAPTNPEILEKIIHWPNIKQEARKMDEITKQLYGFIKMMHVGRNQAIKSKDLCRALWGSSMFSNAERELRSMIEDINHNHNGMICSSPADGYWWGNDLIEDLKAVGRLEKRAKKQLDNVSHLKRNLQRTLGGQMEIGSKEWFESVEEIPY